MFVDHCRTRNFRMIASNLLIAPPSSIVPRLVLSLVLGLVCRLFSRLLSYRSVCTSKTNRPNYLIPFYKELGSDAVLAIWLPVSAQRIVSNGYRTSSTPNSTAIPWPNQAQPIYLTFHLTCMLSTSLYEAHTYLFSSLALVCVGQLVNQ